MILTIYWLELSNLLFLILLQATSRSEWTLPQGRRPPSTYSGLYEFGKLPFRLVNAPATFQWLMESVLAELARDKCMLYLNDILVIGKTVEEHNANRNQEQGWIRSAGLRLKLIH